MNLPTIISRTSPFQILGMLGGACIESIFKRTLCMQIVKILICISTVCPCPIKGTLGLYGLIELVKTAR